MLLLLSVAPGLPVLLAGSGRAHRRAVSTSGASAATSVWPRPRTSASASRRSERGLSGQAPADDLIGRQRSTRTCRDARAGGCGSAGCPQGSARLLLRLPWRRSSRIRRLLLRWLRRLPYHEPDFVDTSQQMPAAQPAPVAVPGRWRCPGCANRRPARRCLHRAGSGIGPVASCGTIRRRRGRPAVTGRAAGLHHAPLTAPSSHAGWSSRRRRGWRPSVDLLTPRRCRPNPPRRRS